jgi:hypothetical protein
MVQPLTNQRIVAASSPKVSAAAAGAVATVSRLLPAVLLQLQLLLLLLPLLH